MASPPAVETGGPPSAATPDERDWNGRLAFLLKRSQLLFARRHTERLAAHGLTEREFALLTLIEATPGRSQRRLGEELFIDRTSIVALVDALEAKALVARSRDASDRRVVVVSATPRGRRRLAAATKAVAAAEEEFLAVLPPDAARLLRDALAQIVQTYSNQA